MTETREPLRYEDWEDRLISGIGVLESSIESFDVEVSVEEIGHVSRVDGGVAEIAGLPRVRSEELVEFASGALGLAYDLSPDRVGVILLDEMAEIESGEEARRSGRVLSTPVGEALLGRVIDPTGRSLDGRGRVEREDLRPVESPAPAIMDRAPVDTPLQTGIKAIDALIPIGRGQRELIVGDRQTGKTAIAVDTILNQRDTGVICIYCAVGIRSSAVAKIVSDLEEGGALEYTTVVVAAGDDPPGRQFIAPYAAMTIAEYFAERGDDALVVFDDLTRHARAYRELSLLLRRPPGREAYPGDIFYIHSRLLERPTNLKEAGTLTALPIIETQAQNISAYIPTNLISITDGQIYLSPKLFQQGVLPAIDIGRSVSRVGGRAQLPAYRSVSGDLRLSYSQFEELERFSRYGARLEEERAQQLRRGRRVREILKQPQYQPLDVREQIAVLAAVTGGAFDEIELDNVREAIPRVKDRVLDEFSDLFDGIAAGEELEDEDLEQIQQTAHDAAIRRE